MYQKILQEILTAHPLFGIEKETQNLGKRIGLKPPDWIYEGPVYEIFVRNFSKSGTIDAVRNKISYITGGYGMDNRMGDGRGRF